ncbi:MAG: flagellar hook-associated protein 1 [Actinomycetota bacterium]|nr:MAG: flagellar hook-associated protein 1 [Actinomycetota bacterium]
MADFVSLNTALTALRAARVRIDTAAGNVANAATPGYTRRRAELVPAPSYLSAYGWIGGGVDVDGVVRTRDAFLDARVRGGQDLLGQLSVRSELLQRAEAALAEPEQGISAPLADLWAAFEDLALDPTSSGARITVLGALGDVADRVRGVASAWDALERDAATTLGARVEEVNGLLGSLADVNRAIVATPTGQPDATLLDRRDALVDRLAVLVGAHAIEQGDGTVRVSVGGIGLVDGAVATTIRLTPSFDVVDASTGATLVPGGEVGGYRRFLLQDLPGLRAGLDAFARDLADALNAQHEAGWVSDTTPGGPLLSYAPGNVARTLQVAISDPADLAASSQPGPPFPAFDGGNARALADLRTALVASGGTDTLGGAARALAVGLGATLAGATRATETQRQLTAAAELARQGEHGVSLDEEMTGLIEARHAFDAAARLMSVVDEALDVLINRTGLVGR